MSPADDKLAIGEIVARYADYCDHGRWKDVVGLFAPDGVFDASKVYDKTMTGSAELHGFFESAPAAVGHHPTSWYTEVDGDSATNRMKMFVIFKSGIFSVDYDWRLRREGDGWLIERQTIDVVGRLTLPRA